MVAPQKRLLGSAYALTDCSFALVESDFTAEEREELRELIDAYGGVVVPGAHLRHATTSTVHKANRYTLTTQRDQGLSLQQLVTIIRTNSAAPSCVAPPTQHEALRLQGVEQHSSTTVIDLSGEESDDDNTHGPVLSTSLEIRLSVQDSLTHDVPWGAFYASAPLPSNPNPVLSVSGLGGIGLPLSERDALSLIALKHPWALTTWNPRAPTQLPGVTFASHEVQFGNAAWAEAVLAATNQLCDGLDLAGLGPWTAILRCLLLETEDGTFNRQQPSSGNPILEIVLPSTFCGGGRKFALGSYQAVYGNCNGLNLGVNCLAWLPGTAVTCELLDAGYRLSLLYDIVPIAPLCHSISAFARNDKLADLQRSMREWTSLASTTSAGNLQWLLAPIEPRSEWQQADISRLDRDPGLLFARGWLSARKMNCIRDLVFAFDLSSLANEQEDVAAVKTGIDTRDLSRRYVVRPNQVIGAVYRDLEDRVSQVTVPTQHMGGILAYVFIPRHNLVNLVFEHGRKDANAMGWMLNAITGRVNRWPAEKLAKDNLARLCSRIRSDLSTGHTTQGNATSLMRAASTLDDLHLFRWACEIGSVGSSSLSLDTASTLAVNAEQLLIVEERLISTNYDLERLKPWHIVWLSCSPSLGRRFARLKPLVKLLAKKTDADALRPWFDDAVLSIVNNAPLSVYADDADILADATYRYQGEWVFERLMPTLRRRQPEDGFWLTFLDKVYTQGMPTERMRRIWQDVLDHMLAPYDDWRRNEPSTTGWAIFPRIRATISTNRLYMTLRGCVLIGASPQARAILAAATKQIAETETTSMACLIEPLIRRLVNSLTKKVVADVKDALAHFVKTALKAHVRKSVGFEPLRKRDWRRNMRGCSACAECEALNAFLLDRTQQTASFRKRTERRSHLRGQISGTALAFDKSQKLEVEEIDDGEWPKILSVRKVDSVFDEEHRAWRDKRDAMISYVEELDPGNACALLGGLYESLLKTETYTRSAVVRPTNDLALGSAERERTLASTRGALMPVNANLGMKRQLNEGEDVKPDCTRAVQSSDFKRIKLERQQSSKPLDLLQKASG